MDKVGLAVKQVIAVIASIFYSTQSYLVSNYAWSLPLGSYTCCTMSKFNEQLITI